MPPAIAFGLCVAVMQISAYEFIPRARQNVEFMRGDTLFGGYLDQNGEFTQSYTFDKPLALYRSGPSHLQPITLDVKSLTPVAVFELRSGALIPGTMVSGGPFVPEVGGKIIRFSDYVYSPTAIKIWNLPGYFHQKGTPKSEFEFKFKVEMPWETAPDRTPRK